MEHRYMTREDIEYIVRNSLMVGKSEDEIDYFLRSSNWHFVCLALVSDMFTYPEKYYELDVDDFRSYWRYWNDMVIHRYGHTPN